MKTAKIIQEDISKLSGDELLKYVIRLRNESFTSGRNAALCGDNPIRVIHSVEKVVSEMPSA